MPSSIRVSASWASDGVPGPAARYSPRRMSRRPACICKRSAAVLVAAQQSRLLLLHTAICRCLAALLFACPCRAEGLIFKEARRLARAAGQFAVLSGLSNTYTELHDPFGVCRESLFLIGVGCRDRK